MSKSINDIRCEFMDNSNELIRNIIKYLSIVLKCKNVNLLSFKRIKNQEEFTSLFKFIIDLNEKITQFNDNFKNVTKEEELPNLKEEPSTPMNPMMFDFPPDLKEKPMNPMMFDFPPDLKEKPSTPESNQNMNSTMNPMMGGMGMNPMMGGMGMNPMMFGFQSPMFYPPSPKQSPTKENTDPDLKEKPSTPESNQDMNSTMNPKFPENIESTKENESENTESE